MSKRRPVVSSRLHIVMPRQFVFTASRSLVKPRRSFLQLRHQVVTTCQPIVTSWLLVVMARHCA
jgi:hypothetical protein